MIKVTSLDHVAAVLGVDKAQSYVVQAYEAAEGAVGSLCRWQSDSPEISPPQALVQSVILRTARYLARRDTPTGVLGVGEFGPVRIAAVDRDIEELEGPWRRVVFG